jgi:hypothetical protein
MEECDLQYASSLNGFVVVLRVVGLGSIWEQFEFVGVF